MKWCCRRTVLTRPSRTITLLCVVAGSFSLAGCGLKFGHRHFAGPILPVSAQENESFTVGDDRSITFVLDRLEISLRSVTAEMLNRQFARNSEVDDGSAYRNPTQMQTNPFTFGDWVPPEAERAPTRFTVFFLNVKNYAFPKVRVDPEKVVLTAANGRRYPALSLHALLEYYWPYAVAYAGNTYKSYEERRDLLRKSMFRNENIFSGQEYGGYVVFPALDYDVEDFEVMVHDAILRFDYRNEPTETVNIPYQFSREVYQAKAPRTEEYY